MARLKGKTNKIGTTKKTSELSGRLFTKPRMSYKKHFPKISYGIKQETEPTSIEFLERNSNPLK